MALQPGGVDALRLFVGIGAVEQHRPAGIGTAAFQQLQQVGLGAPGLGEDQRLLVGAQLLQFDKGFSQRGEQRLAFGVVADRCGQALEFAQLRQFVGHAGTLLFGCGRRVGLGPFFFGFVQCFVVLIQCFFGGLFFACARGFELVLEPLRHGA